MMAKGLAKQTIKNCEITLKQSLNDATEEHRISYDPLLNSNLSKLMMQKKLMHCLIVIKENCLKLLRNILIELMIKDVSYSFM